MNQAKSNFVIYTTLCIAALLMLCLNVIALFGGISLNHDSYVLARASVIFSFLVYFLSVFGLCSLKLRRANILIVLSFFPLAYFGYMNFIWLFS